MTARIHLATLFVLALCAGPLRAQESLRATWLQPSIVESAPPHERDFELRSTHSGTYAGLVRPPFETNQRRVTLRRAGQGWEARIERPQSPRPNVGLTGSLSRFERRIEEREWDWRWVEERVVALRRRGRVLGGRGLRIELPDAAPQPAQRPRLRVLLTGFAAGPDQANHPRFISAGHYRDPPRTPSPSCGAVRRFRLERLDAGLRDAADIEVERLADLPWVYGRAAAQVEAAIERLQPDLVIAFADGAEFESDADVESRANNRKDDDWHIDGDGGCGPFQLPADFAQWPGTDSWAFWPADKKRWLKRYPDADGVSWNGGVIEPGRAPSVRSLLPVARIVAGLESRGLNAIPGGLGDHSRVPNEVAYRLIRAQEQRGGLGGLVRLANWDPARRSHYVQVVHATVETALRALLEREGLLAGSDR